MDDNQLRNLWKRTKTPELDALANKLEREASEQGYDLNLNDLSELCFLAFKAGYEARGA